MDFSAAAAGNRDAIEALLSLYRPGITRYARRRCARIEARFDAEDAGQVTLVKAFESLSRGEWIGRTEDEFRAWIYRRARVVCRTATKAADSKCRAISRGCSLSAKDGSSIDVAVREPSTLDRACFSETVNNLIDHVRRDDDREILYGIAEGREIHEIAEGLGYTLQTVYWRTKYLRKLARRLETVAAMIAPSPGTSIGIARLGYRGPTATVRL